MTRYWHAAELPDGYAGVSDMRIFDGVTVFVGRENATERGVSLKVVHSPLALEVEALEREADLLACLGAHPNIVTFYQRTAKGGRPVLIVERWSHTLADVLADGPLPVADAVAIGIKLAGALETVHGCSVVHCAVRPENIRHSDWGEPILDDFRFASARNVPPVDGGLLRTPAPHTAPELLLGEPVTEATDVYGLAATLYELIDGRPAVRSYADESPAALCARIICQPVRPLIGVPLELSDLLVQALAVDPVRRPSSMGWFAAELIRIARHHGWPCPELVVGMTRPRPAALDAKQRKPRPRLRRGAADARPARDAVRTG